MGVADERVWLLVRVLCDLFLFICSDAFDLNFAVVVFRLRAGFDATELSTNKGMV